MNLKPLKDKRGVLGLDTAKAFILAILTIGVIAFAVIIALNALQNADVDSSTENDTGAVLGNISEGTVSFFSNAGTWFALLAIVIIILVIAVVIVAVNRFGRGGGGL